MDFAFETIDHVQLAIPRGAEAEGVAYFHGVLGFEEVPKPQPLAARGGCFVRAGAVVVHRVGE